MNFSTVDLYQRSSVPKGQKIVNQRQRLNASSELCQPLVNIIGRSTQEAPESASAHHPHPSRRPRVEPRVLAQQGRGHMPRNVFTKVFPESKVWFTMKMHKLYQER
jgi:hypothetical protein